jgi:hypothetical protein
LIALRKEILLGICYLEGRRRTKVNKYFVNFADSWATTPLMEDFIDWTGVERKRPGEPPWKLVAASLAAVYLYFQEPVLKRVLRSQ